MNGKERIGTKQMAALIIFATIGDMLFILPPAIAGVTKQDAWIASLLGLAAGLLIAGLLYVFGKSLGDNGLIKHNKDLLGKWAGGLVSVVYLVYFLLNGALMIRETADFLTSQLFPETPMRAIHGLAIIALMFGVKYGLPSIARAGEILLPIVVILFVALVLLLLPQIKPERMQPVLASGFPEILHGTVMAAAYPYCQLCVMLMIMPFVAKRKHLARDCGIAAAIGGAGCFTIVLMSILVLGGPRTAYYVYPVYVLSGTINIGQFLERVEAILAIILVLLTYMKTVLYFYAFTLGTAQMFKLGDYRPLVIPTGLILFGLAFLISPNVVYFNDVILRYWLDLDIVVGLLIPAALIVWHKMKTKPRRSGPSKA
ncbi:MAG: spore gernimation protein [Paenibacillus sp.]|jgi:spore germination protein KB|nr:spore gernimation protein [Paenibacillus sp.]